MQTEEYIVLRTRRPGSYLLIDRLVRTREGIDVGALAELRIETIEADRKDVTRLREQSDVLAVGRPMPVGLIAPTIQSATSSPSTPHASWGIQAVGAETSKYNAEAVVVAVLDTGIDSSHEAFAGMEIEQRDFTGAGPGDGNGHGTHCAGTIFGRSVSNARYSVAPTVRKALIGKVLDNHGRGSTRALVEGILWALTQGAHIMTMSLGINFPRYVKGLTERGLPVELATSKALEAYRENIRMFDQLSGVVRSRAFGKGSLLIAAAGNASRRDKEPAYELAVEPPAAAEGIVSVGALERAENETSKMKVAAFSNSGPIVVAPGVDILSAKAGGGYIEMSGTSMATPHVAGIAALWAARMIEEDGDLDIGELAHRVIGGARRLPGLERSDTGAGLVQAPPSSD